MSYPPIRLQFSSKTVSFFSGISSGFYYSAFLSCWLSVKQSHQSNAPIKSNHTFTPPASPNSPFPSSFTTSVTVWSIFIRLTSSSLLFFFVLSQGFHHIALKNLVPLSFIFFLMGLSTSSLRITPLTDWKLQLQSLFLEPLISTVFSSPFLFSHKITPSLHPFLCPWHLLLPYFHIKTQTMTSLYTTRMKKKEIWIFLMISSFFFSSNFSQGQLCLSFNHCILAIALSDIKANGCVWMRSLRTLPFIQPLDMYS